MPSNIERLNYYEREHLRSFDFIAEQNYHLEMRRRLNLALHLWGIVEGLDVRKGSLGPGLPDQVFITEGMAIDAYGREIVLFSPYPLTEVDVRNNRIDQNKTYSLWIAYDRQQTTPPSAGYGICDATGQYTRWRESAKILIKEQSFANGPEPRVFDTLSDDPENASWLVPLGTVVVGEVNGVRTITDGTPEKRIYIGLRAQRVVASVNSLQPPSADVSLPIAVENDILEKKNLIVGTDFPIDPTKVKPAPADPTKFPGPSGNIKAENLFLFGNLYSNVGGEWFGGKEYLKTLIPEIVVDQISIPILPTAVTTSMGFHEFNKTSNLTQCSGANLMVALAGVELKQKGALDTWWDNVAAADAPIVQLSAAVPSRVGLTGSQFKFRINWTVGPKDILTSPDANQILPIESILVSYMAVFYP